MAKLLKHEDQLAKTQVGTPYYVSPEVWKNRAYDAKCDIWSLGVLLYEISTLRRPFEAENVQSLISKVMAGRYAALPPQYSKELSAIIKKMLGE